MKLGPTHKLLAVCVAVAVLAACATPDAAPPLSEAGPVWPPPPEPPRIQFVGEFTSPEDLGIKATLWSRVVELTVGTEDTEMVRPMAVAALRDGSVIFVADPGALCVHRFDTVRNRYRCLRPEPEHPLGSPIALALEDDTRLFVSDSATGTVFSAGLGDDVLQPLALTPPPTQPTGVAIGAAGDLFVADTSAHKVLRYDPDKQLASAFGGRGGAPGQMNYPTYLWLGSARELLVADTMNFRVQRLDPEDGPLGQFGSAGDASGTLARPKGVAMDPQGHIYIVDAMHHAFHIYDRDGRLLLSVGQQGSGPGEFWLPSGIYITPENLIFIADSYNRRVQVFQYLGETP